ncbi:hydroxyphenylacetyl-CoA thioesterase PaaI [Vannielia litorea]|uniref:hydroxyphenylacetyl-CoA thioesterase PaaI n=1 Tax=Vannielia litorea TaxID=1217970 RepID=UPI001C96EE55|nr:hydroxyphenylacetyl-CoA thioesterase PaaI [Vannielia litorea]MBY6046542.1 hydroxyphenylacetyl-CoA thioesterase PaaI [Vannielia litorea]MBY6073955.1 hydroxyphenylacetyl-CoA thioesterase PaaI [Vannielia litorea]
MTPEARAAQSAAVMWAQDAASKWLGMELGAITEGAATLTLKVEPHHCNGHGTCHGGIIFALADSAFAFACNSRNQSTVAQQNQITYLAPGRLGETLTATANETSLQGRTGLTDVTVTGEEGRVIAQFRGLSRAIPGTLFDEGADT